MAEGLVYHNDTHTHTHKNLKILYALVSTGYFCKGYETEVAQE